MHSLTQEKEATSLGASKKFRFLLLDFFSNFFVRGGRQVKFPKNEAPGRQVK
jgi:hypothetical protein